MIERVFVTLLVAFGALTAVRVIAPFRALLLPALPRRGRGRLRRVLGVHSYLPRWWSAGYFVSTWAFGLAAVFLALRLDLDRMSPWLASAVATVSYLGLSVYIGAAHVYYHDVRGREQLRIQHRRDAWAEQALTDLRHGRESRGHSVWLRSFQSTGRVRVIAKSKYVKLKGEDVEKGGLHIYLGDFETMLAEAVEHVAPLIALGESGEQIGAGRVRTREEDWREVFTLLTASAHTIYLMPSLRPGTQWELDQVLTTPDLLRRCVFVLPPEYEPRLRVRARFEEPGAARTRNTDVTAARVDAIEAFAGILDGDDLARVHDATAGALIRIGNPAGRHHVVDLVPLRVAGWWLGYWHGPRFVKSSLRTAATTIG